MNPEDVPATAEETIATPNATAIAEGDVNFANNHAIQVNNSPHFEQHMHAPTTAIPVETVGAEEAVPVDVAAPTETEPAVEQQEETGIPEQNPQLEVMRQMLEQMQQMLNQMQQNQENMMHLIEAMVTRQNEHEDRLNQQNQQQEAPQAEEVPNDNDPDQEPTAPNQQVEQPAAGIVVAPEAAEPQVVVAEPVAEAPLTPEEEEPQAEQQNRLRRFWNRLRGEYYGAGTAYVTGRIVTPEQQGATRRSRLLKRGLAAALLVAAGVALAKGYDALGSSESAPVITDGTPGLEGDGTNGLGSGGPTGGEAGGFDQNKGRSHIDFVGEKRVSGVELPPDLEMTRNAEGKLHIVNNHGNEIVPPLESMQDQQGNLSQEAKEILRSKGFKLKQDTLLENRFMTSVSS